MGIKGIIKSTNPSDRTGLDAYSRPKKRALSDALADSFGKAAKKANPSIGSASKNVDLEEPAQATSGASSLTKLIGLHSETSESWMKRMSGRPGFDDRILGFAADAFKINAPYMAAVKMVHGSQTFFDAFEVADKHLNPLRSARPSSPGSFSPMLGSIDDFNIICFPSALRRPVLLGTRKDIISRGLDEFAIFHLLSIAGAGTKEFELEGRIIYEAMAKLRISPLAEEDLPSNLFADFSKDEIRLASYPLMITASAIENSKLLPYFLNKGIKPYEWDSDEWHYPLDIAIKNGCKANAELLMKYGATAESSREFVENDLIINERNRTTVTWFKETLNNK